MVSTHLDLSVFVPLLTSGGEELRDQLLIDLQQFEAVLKTHCLSRMDKDPVSDQSLEAALHSLGGLAVTIGAGQLAALCLDLEQNAGLADPVTRLQRIASVIEETARIRLKVRQRCGLR